LLKKWSLTTLVSVSNGEPTWTSGGSLDVIGRAVTRQRLATKLVIKINQNFMLIPTAFRL
jgi:hypothetical protein